MNILRAAVIMASTSREKSSKESLSMPSSQTRGMLAACFVRAGGGGGGVSEAGVPFLEDT